MTTTGLSMKESEERFAAAEAHLGSIMGVVNAAHGELVDEVAHTLETGLWEVWGVHSPAHWLAWQSGIDPVRARNIVRIAERRDELPTAVAALRSGALSVEAVIEIAKRAPAEYEQSITEFAKVATFDQLRRSLREYAYDPDTEAAKPKPREDLRSVATGSDAKGWWMRARLPLDEGSVLEKALQASRDDLFRQAAAERGEGEPPPQVGLADGLVGVAESFLRAGQAAHPGSDRYLIHVHLDGHPHPNGDPHRPDSMLSFHLGAPVPAALRSMMLCDGALQATWWGHGVPVSVGRKTRVIGGRLRRAIEHRDGGCTVPGCGRRSGLEIHHIVHWEHGGPTDTANVVTLCRAHHRAHHQQQLGITGNPDLPADAEGALAFRDSFGRIMAPSGHPTPSEPGAGHRQTAEQAGIVPTEPYVHPLGERLDRRALSFNKNEPPRPSAPKDHDPGAEPPSGPSPTPGSNSAETAPEPGHARGDGASGGPPSDPRRGGPPTTNSPPAS